MLKICLVCSFGGHLTELMALSSAFESHDCFYLTYDSDRTRDMERAYLIDHMPSKPLSVPKGLLRILMVLLREKPDLVVSTGAEIAIPAFVIAKTMGVKTVFVETCARTKRPSGTARIVYPFSDFFFVQWRCLLKHFGKKARYDGGLL